MHLSVVIGQIYYYDYYDYYGDDSDRDVTFDSDVNNFNCYLDSRFYVYADHLSADWGNKITSYDLIINEDALGGTVYLTGEETNCGKSKIMPIALRVPSDNVYAPKKIMPNGDVFGDKLIPENSTPSSKPVFYVADTIIKYNYEHRKDSYYYIGEPGYKGVSAYGIERVNFVRPRWSAEKTEKLLQAFDLTADEVWAECRNITNDICKLNTAHMVLYNEALIADPNAITWDVENEKATYDGQEYPIEIEEEVVEKDNYSSYEYPHGYTDYVVSAEITGITYKEVKRVGIPHKWKLSWSIDGMNVTLIRTCELDDKSEKFFGTFVKTTEGDHDIYTCEIHGGSDKYVFSRRIKSDTAAPSNAYGDSDFTVKIDGDWEPEDLESVIIGGVEVPKENYTVESGCVLLTFKKIL